MLCFRLGRRANHQMLTMVARTPNAAAGLAILRERSDISVTLPGWKGNGDTEGAGAPTAEHFSFLTRPRGSSQRGLSSNSR